MKLYKYNVSSLHDMELLFFSFHSLQLIPPARIEILKAVLDIYLTRAHSPLFSFQ